MTGSANHHKYTRWATYEISCAKRVRRSQCIPPHLIPVSGTQVSYHGEPNQPLHLYKLGPISQRVMTITWPIYVRLHVMTSCWWSLVYMFVSTPTLCLSTMFPIDSVRPFEHYVASGLWGCGYLPPFMTSHGLVHEGVTEKATLGYTWLG